jgi:hypothetical protein
MILVMFDLVEDLGPGYAASSDDPDRRRQPHVAYDEHWQGEQIRYVGYSHVFKHT